jgi:hypothetical protein
MSGWFAVGDEMPEPLTPHLEDDFFTLDDVIIEALVSGLMDESLPDAYHPVVAVLAGAAQPSTEAELADEAGTAAVFRTLRPSTGPTRRSLMSRRLLSAKTLLAAGALTVASATGAAAATGSLPGAAQDTAATVLAKVGISVPGPDSHSDEHPATRGGSEPVTDDSATTTADSTSNTSATAKNDTIVSLATDPSRTGIDKAQAVSGVASDGKSEAGINGPPASTPAGPPDSLSTPAGPPASTPAGPPESTPAGPPASTPAGAPVSTPAGPPASTPAGAPLSTPAGPPESTPAGPPVSTPDGPPESTPAGPPASTPDGPPASTPGPNVSEPGSAHQP